MTDDSHGERGSPLWTGRLAAILIAAFIVLVLVLMFFATRGPRG